jgi:hypothetical protein
MRNEMSDEFPLYPTLAPEAIIEAQALMDGFKAKMLKLCDETLGNLYCNVSAYIESDHWTNYRNDLLAGLRNYGNRKVQASYDFAAIRLAIFNEFRAEIIPDINQDLLAEVESLKKQLVVERERSRF